MTYKKRLLLVLVATDILLGRLPTMTQVLHRLFPWWFSDFPPSMPT